MVIEVAIPKPNVIPNTRSPLSHLRPANSSPIKQSIIAPSGPGAILPVAVMTSLKFKDE